MTRRFDTQAAMLAVVSTLAILSGVYGVAAYEHDRALVVEAAPLRLATPPAGSGPDGEGRLHVG